MKAAKLAVFEECFYGFSGNIFNNLCYIWGRPFSMVFKKTILLSFLFCCSSLMFSQQKDTLYGNVKSVKEEIFFLDKDRQNMKFFSSDGDYGHSGFISPELTKEKFYDLWYHTPWVSYLNYYKEFNQQGKPVYEIWIDKEGETEREYYYKYDKNENLIQTKNIYLDDLYTIINYNYNQNNKVKTYLLQNSDDPNSYVYSEFIYNESNQYLEINNFNEDGKNNGIKYVYDNKGRLKKLIQHFPYVWKKVNEKKKVRKWDSIGLNKLKEEYFYNNDDKLIETHFYFVEDYNNNKSIPIRNEKREYQNGLLEKVISIKDTINSFIEYEYDEQQRKTKETMTSVNFPETNYSKEYFYDNQGNLVKLIYTEKDTPVTVNFDYSFDKNQNWTKKVKSVDGEKLYVWKRKIKYY